MTEAGRKEAFNFGCQSEKENESHWAQSGSVRSVARLVFGGRVSPASCLYFLSLSLCLWHTSKYQNRYKICISFLCCYIMPLFPLLTVWLFMSFAQWLELCLCVESLVCQKWRHHILLWPRRLRKSSRRMVVHLPVFKTRRPLNMHGSGWTSSKVDWLNRYACANICSGNTASEEHAERESRCACFVAQAPSASVTVSRMSVNKALGSRSHTHWFTSWLSVADFFTHSFTYTLALTFACWLWLIHSLVHPPTFSLAHLFNPSVTSAFSCWILRLLTHSFTYLRSLHFFTHWLFPSQPSSLFLKHITKYTHWLPWAWEWTTSHGHTRTHPLLLPWICLAKRHCETRIETNTLFWLCKDIMQTV